MMTKSTDYIYVVRASDEAFMCNRERWVSGVQEEDKTKKKDQLDHQSNPGLLRSPGKTNCSEGKKRQEIRGM